MTEPSPSERKGWMKQWRNAGPALERVKLDELGRTDLARVAADLEDVCRAAAVSRGLSTSSGLIVQQQIFHRRRVK